MQQFLMGYAAGAAPETLVDQCLDSIGEVPAECSLGLIYATDELAGDLQNIVERLRGATGIPHWTGTVGFGICVTGREYYDEAALVVMLTDFEPDSFQRFASEKMGFDGFIAEHRDWYRQGQAHFGILHGDPTNASTPALLERLADEVPGAFFLGGLTSSEGDHAQIADDIVAGGVSGVLFSQDVQVVAGHTQGCTPISDRHEVTRCERNVIAQLDGRPALDVFKEDIGEVLSKDLNQVAGYIFAGLPIAGSDTGDYLVRNLVGIDTNQKLLAVGEILAEGSQLLFCRRDGNSARQDMTRMLDDIGGRLSANPRGAVYYSCLARGRNQFGDDSQELKMIRDTLGEIPLVGFFANGEVFHNRLYGYTGVLSVFI